MQYYKPYTSGLLHIPLAGLQIQSSQSLPHGKSLRTALYGCGWHPAYHDLNVLSKRSGRDTGGASPTNGVNHHTARGDHDTNKRAMEALV